MAAKEKINIGLVGGGLKSFMGGVHRAAIERAGCFKIARGAFCTTRQGGYDMMKTLGIRVEDVFHQYRELLRAEPKLAPEKRLAFVAAVIPNTMHYPVAMTAMDSGVPVLAEKPFTVNLDEATNLVRKQRLMKTPYRIAMVYPAYSQLVRMRKMILGGEIGTIRRFFLTYQSGWMARRIENQGNKQALWRTDVKHNGAGGVINEAAVSCQFTLEWLTGLRLSEVCTDAYACVPGRTIPDDASVLIHTTQGIHGTFMMSNVSVGHPGGLTVEITGDKAAIFWRESEAGKLTVRTVDGKSKEYEDNTAKGEVPFAETPYGMNAAYLEALARVYREFADEVAGKPKKLKADQHILGMSLEEGLRSVAVTSAIEKSFFPMPPELPPTPKWIQVRVPSSEMPDYRPRINF